MKNTSVIQHVTTLNNKFKEEGKRVTLEACTFLRRFNWGRNFPLPVPPLPPSHKTQNLNIAVPVLFLRSQC
jgi:hypothetical protein